MTVEPRAAAAVRRCGGSRWLAQRLDRHAGTAGAVAPAVRTGWADLEVPGAVGLDGGTGTAGDAVTRRPGGTGRDGPGCRPWGAAVAGRQGNAGGVGARLGARCWLSRLAWPSFGGSAGPARADVGVARSWVPGPGCRVPVAGYRMPGTGGRDGPALAGPGVIRRAQRYPGRRGAGPARVARWKAAARRAQRGQVGLLQGRPSMAAAECPRRCTRDAACDGASSGRLEGEGTRGWGGRGGSPGSRNNVAPPTRATPHRHCPTAHTPASPAGPLPNLAHRYLEDPPRPHRPGPAPIVSAPGHRATAGR